MNIKLTLALFVLLVVPLFGRPSTDVIVMKNGDRFTCEVEKLDKGVLFVSLSYVDGTISVQWSQVARIESSQLFLVQTQDGSQYQGELRTPTTTAKEPVKIEIVESSNSQKVFVKQQVVEMAEASESFWRRFSGNLSTGMTYSRGNNTRQFNLGSDVTYLRPGWSADAQYSSSLSASNHDTASTRNELTAGALKFMHWNNWYYASLADFLQSSQQGIGRQATLGGGIGHYLKNTNRARISLTGGFAFQNTQYESSLNPTQQAVAGLIAGNVQFFIFKKTSLSLKASFLPELNQPGRLRFNTNSSYSIQIIKDLWWRFTFYGNWDSTPPTNLKGSDYGTTSGITYSFN